MYSVLTNKIFHLISASKLESILNSRLQIEKKKYPAIHYQLLTETRHDINQHFGMIMAWDECCPN